MQFCRCRICSTDTNLKYTSKELRKLYRKQRTEEVGKNVRIQVGAFGAPPTTLGNICHDCEERLHNFHRLEEDDQSVIVDDDEHLYNLFFEKIEERKRKKREIERRAFYGLSGEAPLKEDIIEVRSRESTPTFASQVEQQQKMPLITTPVVDSVEHKIVAFIDLEAESEEQQHPLTVKVESDNEEIIFQQVESNVVETRERSIRRTKKRYNEGELRLIASLSLVSSDSEAEENGNRKDDSIAPKLMEPIKSTRLSTVNKNKNNNKCSTYNMTFPHSERGEEHDCELSIGNCPVCKTTFMDSQKLIYHMRCKHRSYDGDVLTERPRCGQDSAMTIRLRFMERFTYYECQLCGQIDAVFKEHKMHVIKKHPIESKSLKDPMMQELKCPICKQRISLQYVTLVKHILDTHSALEYKLYLKEVKNTRGVWSWSSSRHKEMTRTARVFQYIKRKNYFFECKLCRKVVVSHNKHLQHLSTHKTYAPKLRRGKVQTKETVDVSDAATPVTPVTAKFPTMRQRKLKVPQSKVIKSTRKYSQCKKDELTGKKVSKKARNASIVKVKVKPPLRRFPVQQYQCKYCEEIFQGFYRLNIHYLNAHRQTDVRSDGVYHGSNINKRLCTYKRTSPPEEEIHNMARCKRKGINPESCETLDENCNRGWSSSRRKRYSCANPNLTNKKREDLKLPGDNGPQIEVVKEWNTASIIKGKTVCDISGGLNILKFSHQCEYCTHLFSSPLELQNHEKEHTKLKNRKIIRRLTVFEVEMWKNQK